MDLEGYQHQLKAQIYQIQFSSFFTGFGLFDAIQPFKSLKQFISLVLSASDLSGR